MKSVILSILLSAAAAHGQAVLNVTTVVVTPGTTNVIEIPAGEAARVVTARPHSTGSLDDVSLAKAGYTFEVIVGDVIQGPATFQIKNPNCCTASLLSLERWKVKK